MKKKHLLLVLLLVATICIFMSQYGTGTKEQRSEIKNYNPDGICDALLPGCGYCPGEIIGRKCFVKK